MSFTNVFKVIKSVNKNKQDKISIVAYKSLYPYSTMICYGKYDTPLVAITLKSKNSKQLITKRQVPTNSTFKGDFFQFMIDKPNEVFTFVITNLTKKGKLNVNICSGNELINKINVIKPERSYEVPCDARTGKEMMLFGKTKQVINETTGKTEEKKVSVDEDEKEEGSKHIEFTVSVTPTSSNQDLLDLFSSTYWKSSPFIVLRSEKKIPTQEDLYRQDRFLYRSGDVSDGAFEPIPFLEREYKSVYTVNPQSFNISEPQETVAIKLNESNTDSSNDLGLSHFLYNYELFGNTNSTSVDVGSTQSAKIKYGNDVSVNGISVCDSFDYSKTSNVIKFRMSIWSEMKLIPLDKNAFITSLKEEIEKQLKLDKTIWLDKTPQIFESDTCLIDLDSKPDVVICTCGHKCFNSKNITPDIAEKFKNKCPLCRQPLLALINLDE